MKQNLGLGIIGFLVGAIFVILTSSLYLLDCSMKSVRAAYAQTSTVIAETRSQTATPVPTQPTPTLQAQNPVTTPRPEAYYELLADMEWAVYEDPSAVITTLEAELADIDNELDLAAGLIELAFAYLLDGKTTQAEESYQEVLEILPPLLDRVSGVADKYRVYLYLMEASIGLDDYQTAEDYFQQMLGAFEAQANPPETFQEITTIYPIMIEAATLVGEYSLSSEYYTVMKNKLPPLIAELQSIEEINAAYSKLRQVAMDAGEFDDATGYNQQLQKQLEPFLENADAGEVLLIYTYLLDAANTSYDYEMLEEICTQATENLGPRLDEITTDDELLEANKLMALAEMYLGHYQFAAVYYKTVAQLEPTVENMYTLAYTYSAGGNHECAYYWYQLLLKNKADELGEYKEAIEGAVATIEEIYGDCDIPTCLVCME